MMSRTQKLFTMIFHSRAQELEAESRRWMMRGACGHEYSVWDAGGVRWKASGNPRAYRRCMICGQGSWHTIYKQAS
jgi:hypothetical protein